MFDDLKIGLQYCMPKHLITRAAGFLAGAKLGFVTTAAIKGFIYQYKVAMEEAKAPDPKSYATFNDFFVRELKDGARPLVEAESDIALPDACVSQIGSIETGRMIQAKGFTFDVYDLVGGDEALAKTFEQGLFATLYLSPRDYHRVHMPCNGTLRQMIYIPGDLFSVNPLTAENVPNLFARNERVVCVFDTDFGQMVQVLVGATIVGSIETPWAGQISPPRGKSIHRWEYPADGAQAIQLKKGDEMGRFKLGSTVITLFPKAVLYLMNN